MISLKTNLSSLNTQNQAAKSKSELDASIRRLSSGLRINSASDNAAGQAIANRLASQQSALAVGKRNAGDGLSMVETAQSALDEINNRLQRIRELTVQGLNGINSQEDSDAIQAEINLNLKAIDQLNSTSSFNGINLLDGSAGKLGFQVGAHDNEKIDLDLSSPGFSVDELGLKDLIISGISGTVSDVNRYTGYASSMSLSNSAIAVNYTGTTLTSPKLVRSPVDNEYYIQGTDANGNTAYNLATYRAIWDTQTGTGTITINAYSGTPLYSDAGQIPSRAITSLDVFDADGNAVSGGTLTEDNGQYYIQQGDTYFPASLTFGPTGAVTAQITDPDGKEDFEFTTLPTSVTTTPEVDSSTVATTFTDANGNAVAGRLMKSGSQYLMEVNNGGNLQYYPATFTATTNGTATTLSVVATAASSVNSFTDVTDVFGNAYVTLDPANVQLNYTDAEGKTFSDVLRLDSDGNYYMDLPGSGESKTATLVVHNTPTSPLLLKTLNGVGEVQVYYATSIYSNTDTDTNHTVMNISEVGSGIRLRNPDDPLATLDRAIQRIDARRTQLGAVANRLESVQNLQDSATSAIAATRSRIEDADYATEVSAMTRAQLLQQASAEMLVKANSTPELVLALLRG
ncbi:flagellin [Phytobacter sp. V91]|uniref:flagellin N-terminal helical domain-containing protein n=1 Tax=Phytobacter sp. V91 TaxID=3369425 RepID=UPI003F61FD4A